MPPQSPQDQLPQYNQYESSPLPGKRFSSQKLWLIIGAAAVIIVVIVVVFFGSREKTEDEIKAEILRSLSAPSNAPQISAEEKQRILESLTAPSNAPQISAEEKQRILESLSAPAQ